MPAALPTMTAITSPTRFRFRAITSRRMSFALSFAFAIASGSAAAKGPVAPVRLPEAVLGVWHPDTREGRDACRRYLATPEDSDEVVWALFGAVIVRPALLHHVSDMGEGNFVEVDEARQAGPTSWRVRGRLGIDGEAEPGATVVDALLTLRGSTLELRETIDGDAQHGRYARCAAAL